MCLSPSVHSSPLSTPVPSCEAAKGTTLIKSCRDGVTTFWTFSLPNCEVNKHLWFIRFLSSDSDRTQITQPLNTAGLKCYRVSFRDVCPWSVMLHRWRQLRWVSPNQLEYGSQSFFCPLNVEADANVVRSLSFLFGSNRKKAVLTLRLYDRIYTAEQISVFTSFIISTITKQENPKYLSAGDRYADWADAYSEILLCYFRNKVLIHVL